MKLVPNMHHPNTFNIPKNKGVNEWVGEGATKKTLKKTNFSVDITSGREGALTVWCYTGVLLARIKLYPQICTPTVIKTLTA